MISIGRLTGIMEHLEKRATDLIDTGDTDLDIGEGIGIQYAIELIKHNEVIDQKVYIL